MSDILDTIDELEDEDFEMEELNSDSDLSSDDEALEGEIFDLEIRDDEMSEDTAREITDAIRSAATATYILLAQAHEGKAYKALGYETWADYVKTEFDMSTSRSYQLLDLSKVMKQIEEASPEGTQIKLTEAQARDLKREIPKITEEIREKTKGKTAEESADIVGDILDEAREQKKADDKAIAEREKNVQEAEQEGYQRGLEAAADAFLEQNEEEAGDKRKSYEADSPEYLDDDAEEGFVSVEVEGDGNSMPPEQAMNLYNFFNVLTNISSLPEPAEFIKTIPDHRAQEITNQLDEATSWLNRFHTMWEERD